MTPLQVILTSLLSAEDCDKLNGYGEMFLTSRRYLKGNRDAQRAREEETYLINGETYHIDGVLDYSIAKASDVIILKVKHEHYTITEIYKSDEPATYVIFIASQRIPQIIAEKMIGTKISDSVSGMEAFVPLAEKLLISDFRLQEVTPWSGGEDCHLTLYCDYIDIPSGKDIVDAI